MLNGQIALVTGASRGIGRAIALELGALGATVIGTATSPEGAAKISAFLSDAGSKGEGCMLEVRDATQVDALIRHIEKAHGAVTVLVNNAGISVNADINSMRPEQFDEQRALMKGIWYLTKRILRVYMLRKNSGRIINISSVVGHSGNAGQIPYTMEKAALDAFTKSLAKELSGRNILVNSVAPGLIPTTRIPSFWLACPRARVNAIRLAFPAAPAM